MRPADVRSNEVARFPWINDSKVQQRCDKDGASTSAKHLSIACWLEVTEDDPRAETATAAPEATAPFRSATRLKAPPRFPAGGAFLRSEVSFAGTGAVGA
jgi:hypothetical protein